MSPGGLRGLQIRWEVCIMPSVGSTPIRSRHNYMDLLFVTQAICIEVDCGIMELVGYGRAGRKTCET